MNVSLALRILVVASVVSLCALTPRAFAEQSRSDIAAAMKAAGAAMATEASAADQAANQNTETTLTLSGNGNAVLGPFALIGGRYRQSFTCFETFGYVIPSSALTSGFASDSSEDGAQDEHVITIDPANDIYIEVNCDADWKFSITPLS